MRRSRALRNLPAARSAIALLGVGEYAQSIAAEVVSVLLSTWHLVSPGNAVTANGVLFVPVKYRSHRRDSSWGVSLGLRRNSNKKLSLANDDAVNMIGRFVETST
jgi:hypothetical protein